MVERLDLSFRGLMVAGWGRLGHSLRDNDPPAAPPAEGGRHATAAAGDRPQPATSGAHHVLACLYLGATLLPTVTLIPLIWPHHPWIWRSVMAATLLPIELGVLVAHKRAAPRLDARQRRVTGAEEQTMLRQAHTTISAIKTARRRLRVLADHVPVPILDQALWDLAGVLIHRDRARNAQQQLQATLARLATGDPPTQPLVEQLQTRQARLARLRHELDTDLAGRLASLNSLAVACRHFLTNQEITHQAHQAAHIADTVLGTVTTSTQPPSDQAADLAERTTAILDAYQQLERGTYLVGG